MDEIPSVVLIVNSRKIPDSSFSNYKKVHVDSLHPRDAEKLLQKMHSSLVLGSELAATLAKMCYYNALTLETLGGLLANNIHIPPEASTKRLIPSATRE